ncbi:hypothetical protein ACDI10_12495 [Vreelandella venusta]|uniref:hypothetical protein n=1 Tax=Vreelandella venusta TaxID=44935 RepID=UPI00355757D7
MKKKLSFDPQKSLVELKVIWLVVGGFSVLSAFVALVVGLNSELSPEYSYVGFNHAVVVFRVPLAIFALIIPIVALLAANHRSEQTKEQIRVSNEQNRFSNYYKHVEEFEKYLNKIWGEKLYTSSPRKLHKVLFPNARHGDFSISTAVWEHYKSMVSKFFEKTAELTRCEVSDQNRILVEMQEIIIEFANALYLTSYSNTSGSSVNYKGIRAIVKDGDVKLFVSNIKTVTKLVDEVCSFELAYEPSDELKKVLEINFDLLPSSKVLLEKVRPELDLSKLLDSV